MYVARSCGNSFVSGRVYFRHKVGVGNSGSWVAERGRRPTVWQMQRQGENQISDICFLSFSHFWWKTNLVSETLRLLIGGQWRHTPGSRSHCVPVRRRLSSGRKRALGVTSDGRCASRPSDWPSGGVMFISELAVMSLHVCGLAPGVTLPKSGEVTHLKDSNAVALLLLLLSIITQKINSKESRQ